MPLCALLFLAFAVCFQPQVRAGEFQLFNTGVDSSGAPLPPESIDPHWSIVAGPDITPPADAFVLIDQMPFGHYFQSPASAWIWVNADGSDEGQAYTFRLTFDLTGFDPASASISGSWGVDNNGDIFLNGSPAIGTGELSLSSDTTENFDASHDFTITGGFVDGINTLDFVAVDDGIVGGLNVTNLVGTATINPLSLTTAVSRKMHGGAGTFDVNLPLTGEPGVECRSTGGAYTLVFTFSNNVVSGNASVTTGTGSVSGSPTFATNTMTVNLTGVTDVQKITVTLSGVTDDFSQVLPDTAVSVNMLRGDTTGNKTVNSSDISQTKAQSGAPVTSANFREDVTVSGTINSSDISLVKSRSGFAVP